MLVEPRVNVYSNDHAEFRGGAFLKASITFLTNRSLRAGPPSAISM